MFSFSASGARRRWWLGSAVALAVVLWAATVCAQAAQTIVRVEEDWELVVAQPDPEVDAPQIVCVISPVGGVDGVFAALEMNQETLPGSNAGGLQLQVWEGEMPVVDRAFPDDSVMETPGEVVQWTQTMELTGTTLTFEVVGGTSTTWGSFGGQGYLKVNLSTTLPDLNGYCPEVSVENSGVGFAANRVTSLVLKEVRLRTADGQEIRDTTRRVVHSQ